MKNRPTSGSGYGSGYASRAPIERLDRPNCFLSNAAQIRPLRALLRRKARGAKRLVSATNQTLNGGLLRDPRSEKEQSECATPSLTPSGLSSSPSALQVARRGACGRPAGFERHLLRLEIGSAMARSGRAIWPGSSRFAIANGLKHWPNASVTGMCGSMPSSSTSQPSISAEHYAVSAARTLAAAALISCDSSDVRPRTMEVGPRPICPFKTVLPEKVTDALQQVCRTARACELVEIGQSAAQGRHR